jgi:PPM family protein phosphatase
MDRRPSTSGEGSSSQQNRWEEIKSKDVKLSGQTKALDCIRKRSEVHEHGPERVNKEIEQFNKTMREMKNKLDTDPLPEELKKTFAQTAKSLISEFQKSSDQAVHRYGNDFGIGKKNRNEGEKNIKDLNEITQEMNKHQETWKQIYNLQENVNKALNSVKSEKDVYEHIAKQVIDKAQETEMQALKNRENLHDKQKAKQSFQDASGYLQSACRVFEAITKATKVQDGAKIEHVLEQNKFDSNDIKITAGSCTQGKNNPNQDAYFEDPEHQSAGVFDGVSADENSHIGSARARDFVKEELTKLPNDISTDNAKKEMERILKETNNLITPTSTDLDLEEDMEIMSKRQSTTASVVKILKDRVAVIGNVGDSRVYLLRNGSLSVEQLTHDGSWDDNKGEYLPWAYQKVAAHLPSFENLSGTLRKYVSNRNVLDLALGVIIREEIENFKPDIYAYQLSHGDTLILTSDGIHDNLTDGEIAKIVTESSDTKKAAESLVTKSKEISKSYDDSTRQVLRAKPDDMTSIVVKIE